MTAGHITIVVPCFNEATRLDGPALLTLLDEPLLEILFVDDGSTDDTGRVIREIATRAPGRVHVLALERNMGKAEAVRAGMRRALDDGAAITGYLDADLSTPPLELRRVLRALDEDRVMGALGSRVLLLGRNIARRPLRHYLGRVFGTAASLVLDAPIYDTQCGAKVFRRSAALESALRLPFQSRWAFDVELLGRLLEAGLPLTSLVEVPLQEWRDVKGSKLKLGGMAQAAFDLARLARRRR